MIRIRCFGGITIEAPDNGPIYFRSRKHVALLAYLVANQHRAHGRDELIRLFWDSPPSSARHSLSQALYDIKRRLGGLSIQRFGDSLRLTSVFEFDGRLFEEAVKSDELATAVELYRGDFAAAYDKVGTEEFETWVDDERRRYRILAQAALHRYVEKCDGQGDWGQMCLAALKLVKIDPISERAHSSLMRALWLHGDQASALRHFSEVEESLARNVPGGISEETRDLVRRIRSSAPPVPDAIVSADPPMVGREREFAHLRELATFASRGESSMAVIRGEAGIGKTRLAGELARCLAAEGLRVLQSRCYAAEENVAYGPVVDGLRSFSDTVCAVSGSDGPLYPYLRQLLRCEHELADAVDLQADLAGERRRLYEEIVAFMRRLCESQPTLWVVDDVHWIDGSSASLLSYLARRLRDRGLFLLVTVRDDSELSEACRKLLRDRSTDEQASSLTLAPLSLEAVSALVEGEAPEASGRLSDYGRLAKRIHRLSGGNPFLVVELLRDAATAASLETEAIAEEALLSDKVRSLLQARLQGLAPSSIRLLEAVAVLGRNATPGHAAHAGGLTLQDASDVSDELYARGILRDHGDRLEFAHDLSREFVYRNLGGVRRASLHLFVAEALASDVNATLPTIARHFHLGGDRARAFEYAIRAARTSIASFGHEEAKAMAKLALSRASTDAERAATLGILGRAEFATGAMLEAEKRLKQALSLNAAEDPASRALTTLIVARAQMEMCDATGAAKTLDVVLEDASRIVDPKVRLAAQTEAHVLALKQAIRSQDPHTARRRAAAIRQAYDQGERKGSVSAETAALAMYGLAAYAAFFESADDAAALIAKAEAQARQGTGEHLQQALLLAGTIEARRANWDRAENLLAEALAIAAKKNQLLEAGMARNNLAYCAVERGQWHRAHELCEESLRTYSGLPDGTFVKTAPLTNLGDSFLYQGQPRRAKAVYERALSHVTDDYRWQLHSGLGLVSLQMGDLNEARRQWELLRDLGAETLLGVQDRFKVEWLRSFFDSRYGAGAEPEELKEVAAQLCLVDRPGFAKLAWLRTMFFDEEEKESALARLRAAQMSWFAPFSRRWYTAALSNTPSRL